MPTDDEGRICSTCGVYIPVGLPVFFRIGNRTLCAECGQKDPLPSDVSMIQQKIADRPLPLPIWRTGQDYWTLTGFEQDVHWAATGVFYALGVIAFIGGWAAASGPAGGWGFAAGAISACTFFWFAFVLRLLRVAVQEITEIRRHLDQQKPAPPK